MIPSPLAPQTTIAASSRDATLMEQAKALESAFLSEMLGFTGLGQVSEAFGGGAGEAQFASFLRQEQARMMVDRGGIGLAEQIFTTLKSREGGVDGTS